MKLVEKGRIDPITVVMVDTILAGAIIKCGVCGCRFELEGNDRLKRKYNNLRGNPKGWVIPCPMCVSGCDLEDARRT